jgi:diaminopropionate ammonia-lyase
VRALVNPAYAPTRVRAVVDDARAFHTALPGYAPTPLRDLRDIAARLDLGAVRLKDESDRLGLPAFKVLGASWAVERALTDGVDTLVTASAGNHGRAVAHVAAERGLKARIFLPERALPVRRAAIEAEGAEVVIVDGPYEQAVALAAEAGRAPGALEISDVGDSAPAHAVIDGYATLFAEAAEQGRFDVVLVPVGVGALAAAAARFGAAAGIPVIGVEPESAACLTASLATGEPTAIATPGTTMAGLDCAEVSTAAWPDLHTGITGTLTVADDEAAAAMTQLAAAGLTIGESGAAPLAGLRALARDPDAAALRDAVGLGEWSRVLLVATEGRTGG